MRCWSGRDPCNKSAQSFLPEGRLLPRLPSTWPFVLSLHQFLAGCPGPDHGVRKDASRRVAAFRRSECWDGRNTLLLLAVELLGLDNRTTERRTTKRAAPDFLFESIRLSCQQCGRTASPVRRKSGLLATSSFTPCSLQPPFLLNLLSRWAAHFDVPSSVMSLDGLLLLIPLRSHTRDRKCQWNAVNFSLECRECLVPPWFSAVQPQLEGCRAKRDATEPKRVETASRLVPVKRRAWLS